MNNKLIIIPFEPEHLDNIDYRIFDKDSISRWPDILKYINQLPSFGPCYTGLINDEIIGAGGLIILWPGVAEAWLLTGNLTNKFSLSFHKTITKGLRLLIDSMGLHRVQAVVYQYNDIAIKWIERLGFVCEGLMEGYGPDQSNFWRYALIKRRL